MTQDTEAEGAPYDIENDDPDTLFTAFLTGHLEAKAALRGFTTQYEKATICRDRTKLSLMIDIVTLAMGGKAQ